MEYKIRAILAEENYMLQDFLYEAIFVPVGVSAPPKSIINQPELQIYSQLWEQKRRYRFYCGS